MTTRDPSECFVVKPEQIPALNYLDDECPKPEQVEWINRATDQRLRPSSVDQLLRTLFKENVSGSLSNLQNSAGLRAIFTSEKERNSFASHFKSAVREEVETRQFAVTAIFKSPDLAEQAMLALLDEGVPEEAFCILSKASGFVGDSLTWPNGHGRLEITGATAGGGIAGALFGLAIFAIPGVGPVAAAGAAAASAFGSVAALSGVIGATGAALSKVLSDFDVDGLATNYLEQEIKRGSVFVTIDTRVCPKKREEITRQLIKLGGQVPKR